MKRQRCTAPPRHGRDLHLVRQLGRLELMVQVVHLLQFLLVQQLRWKNEMVDV